MHEIILITMNKGMENQENASEESCKHQHMSTPAVEKQESTGVSNNIECNKWSTCLKVMQTGYQ